MFSLVTGGFHTLGPFGLGSVRNHHPMRGYRFGSPAFFLTPIDILVKTCYKVPTFWLLVPCYL